MQNKAVELWGEVLSSLKKDVPAQSFDTWLKPTKALELNEDTLTVEVPNKFFKEWLLDHYFDLLSNSLEQVCGRQVKINLYISTVSPVNTFAGAAAQQTAAVDRNPQRHRSDLYLNPKYTFESFVVGNSNRFAHAASIAVAESPAKAYNPLFIYGGVGLGKTHLMQAVGHYIIGKNPGAKLTYTTSERFTNQLINSIQTRTTMRFREKFRNVDILLIDDIQFIAGKESTQEEFFHTFNTLYDSHKQIILSSDRHPKETLGFEERLISRFEWGLVTDIQPPDLETRVAILRKKAEREITRVPDDVMFFIAEKIKSNIRELEGSLIRVVAYSVLTGTPISIAVAEEVLKDAIKEDSVSSIITVEKIQTVVAENFEVSIADFKKKGRSRAIAYPRQIAMYLSRELTNTSLSEIGVLFGGRDHSTVLHACEKIKKEALKDPQLNNLLTALINRIRTK